MRVMHKGDAMVRIMTGTAGGRPAKGKKAKWQKGKNRPSALERAGGLPHRRIPNGISPVHQTVRCPGPSAQAPFGRAGCAA